MSQEVFLIAVYILVVITSGLFKLEITNRVFGHILGVRLMAVENEADLIFRQLLLYRKVKNRDNPTKAYGVINLVRRKLSG